MGTFAFRVIDGKIKFVNKSQEAAYWSLLGSYNNSGKVLEISIEEFSKDVTQKQGKLFDKIVSVGSEASGHSFSEFRQMLIDEFFPFRYYKDILENNCKEHYKVEELNHAQFQSVIGQAVAFMNTFYDTNFIL